MTVPLADSRMPESESAPALLGLDREPEAEPLESVVLVPAE